MECSSGEQSQVYGVVYIGFGSKALALAAAQADQSPTESVLILERKRRFDADLSAGSSTKQIGSTFLRDLITLSNPRSEFTFVNFLYSEGLLVGFANASQMHSSRLLVGQYMAWAAKKIEQLGWVEYGKEAVCVKPIQSTSRGPIAGWNVDIRDCSTGSLSTIRSKRIVIATGASSHLPEPLAKPEISPFLFNMSAPSTLLEAISQMETAPNIALFGADQQAVELMESLESIPGQHRATMFFPGSALRVEDGTSFSQDIIDGVGSNPHNHLPLEVRQRMVATSVSVKYPTVKLETLESLYTTLYTQRVRQPDITKHRFLLQPLSEIVSAELAEDHKVRLITRNSLTASVGPVPGAFDIIVASGSSDATTPESLLRPTLHMLDSDSLTVDGEYKVNFRRGAITQGCGIWILGSLADQNVRRDDFTILAQVANRAIKSILSAMSCEEETKAGEQLEVARL